MSAYTELKRVKAINAELVEALELILNDYSERDYTPDVRSMSMLPSRLSVESCAESWVCLRLYLNLLRHFCSPALGGFGQFPPLPWVLGLAESIQTSNHFGSNR